MVTYDAIAGTADTIDYTASATDTSLYPDSNNISIFGPIWLPRIYGKDLTAFEIASSGKIAITVNDVHALDISRVEANSNYTTVLASKQSDSLELVVNSNNMSIIMDSTSNDIFITASNDVSILAEYGSTIIASSNEISLIAKSNVELVSTSQSILMSAADSNIYMTMDHTTMDTTLFSSNNISMTASNDFSLTTLSNINVYAGSGSINLNAEGSNTFIHLDGATDNINVYALTDVVINTSNDFLVDATSNIAMTTTGTGSITFTAETSNNIQLTLDGSNATTSWYSSNDFLFTTSNDYSLSAQSAISITSLIDHIKLSSSNDQVYFDLNKDNATMFAVSNISISASNNFYTEAKSNVEITALNGTLAVSANNSNMYMTMSQTDNTISVYGSNSIFFTTSNDFEVTAQDNMLFTALEGEIGLYANSNIELAADGSNMYITMEKTDDVLSIYSASNINMSSCNLFEVNSQSNLTMTSSNVHLMSQSNFVADASNSTYISACNNVYIEAKNDLELIANNFAWTAQSNISFYINSAPVQNTDPIFVIDGTKVNVRGDLYITGSINTSNIINTTVVQESLKVSDKTIILASVGDASAGDSNPIDGGLTNDKSGVVIDGFPDPAVVTDSNDWPAHEKSILWNYGDNGTLDLGTSNVESESYWEVLGGGVRITHRKDVAGTLKDMSFTFRINQLDELELVKTFWSTTTNAYVYKRIAKFGRILA
jgi:uncharacterized protein (DUF2345 family)